MNATAPELPKTTTALRSFAKELGLKGLSAANKPTLVPAITEELERRAVAEQAAAKAGKAPKLCAICGKRRPTSKNGKDFRDQCDPCHVEAGWENTHGDGGHAAILAIDPPDRTAEQGHEIAGCWICFPELNRAAREPGDGRSRAGQVVVAKGDKPEVFRVAAEAAGYAARREDSEQGRVTVTAIKDGVEIRMVWNGRAYDYPASSARFNDKVRKVRNLAEALRLLA